MKILVTGAAGFIGSHVCEKLLERGDTVIGFDNFDPYYDPAQKWANVAILEQYEMFRLVNADVRDRNLILALFGEEQFDGVVHLGALAGVRDAIERPADYINVDYNGSQHLMDASRFNGVKNFVFASTSSVYGDTKTIPFIETDPCDKVKQPYGAAKRGIEILGYAYHYLYGLNFTSVRFFTVYGPRNRPTMMAHLLADSIKHGKQISLYDNGEMYRDWTYVDDTADGVILALDKPLGYEILNLGRGEPVLLRRFVEIMERVAGGKANLVSKPRPAADMVKTFADISKAQRLLGYNPKVSIEDGVRRFWAWYEAKESIKYEG